MLCPMRPTVARHIVSLRDWAGLMSTVEVKMRVETLVIGGGQAGLSVGYYLAGQGLPFLILEANQRIGGLLEEPVEFVATVHAGPV